MPRGSDTLRVGDTAPEFTLPTQRGEVRSLHDFRSRGIVLLAFHRGTWCPNCQTQFGDLSRNSAEYAKRGAQVVAVVGQRSEVVRRYIEETGLPFNILVDEPRDVIKRYGVWHRVGLAAWNIARPALFLVDEGGTIRYIFVGANQDEFPSHTEILRELDGLEESVTQI